MDFRSLEQRLVEAKIAFLTIGPATDGWRANVRTDSSGWTTGDVCPTFEGAVQDAIDKRLASRRARPVAQPNESLLSRMEATSDPLEGLLG